MSDYLDIHALADGELTGAEKAAAEERLRTDPACAAEYQAVSQLKASLQERCNTVSCEKTWSACQGRLNELDKKKQAESFVGKYAWAMCLAIFAIIISAGFYNRQLGQSRVGASEVAKLMSGLGPLSKPASQSQDMRSWIQSVSAGAPVNTERIRVLQYAQGHDELGRSATAFQLADLRGPFTLVVVKGVSEVAGGEPMNTRGAYFAGQIDNMNCLMWTDNGFALTLVGNRTHTELSEIADAIRLR